MIRRETFFSDSPADEEDPLVALFRAAESLDAESAWQKEVSRYLAICRAGVEPERLLDRPPHLDVLDEIRSELQWANRNRPDNEGDRWAVRQITSMPLDPTAPDWAERLNRFATAEFAGLVAEEHRRSSGEQGQLF